jgi:hypothetical protein
MRSFVFPAVIIASLLASASPGAAECDRTDDWTEQTVIYEAKQVFRAKATKVELSDYLVEDDFVQRRAIVHVYYELKETLKGSPSRNGPVTTTTFYFGGCGVPIPVGIDYLFFINEFAERLPEELKADSSGVISTFALIALPVMERNAQKVMAHMRSFPTHKNLRNRGSEQSFR